MRTPEQTKFLDLLIDYRYKIMIIINSDTIRIEALDLITKEVKDSVEIPFEQIVYDIIIQEMPASSIIHNDHKRLQ